MLGERGCDYALRRRQVGEWMRGGVVGGRNPLPPVSTGVRGSPLPPLVLPSWLSSVTPRLKLHGTKNRTGKDRMKLPENAAVCLYNMWQ